jgi:hypothetical protein
LAKIRYSFRPAFCFPQDNDGYVSQQDYRLAKRFDFDGNGVLDPDERAVGKKVLAEEFFRKHEADLHIFGPQIAQNTRQKNVENLVNSYRYARSVFQLVVSASKSPLLLNSFERSYDKLLSVERTFEARSAKKILDCIRSDQNNELLQHNFYTNKFDSTGKFRSPVGRCV